MRHRTKAAKDRRPRLRDRNPGTAASVPACELRNRLWFQHSAIVREVDALGTTAHGAFNAAELATRNLLLDERGHELARQPEDEIRKQDDDQQYAKHRDEKNCRV